MHMKNFEQLENTIGYKFKNKSLLKNALTHSSYANQAKLKYSENNERLEFLGDAVLELVSSEFLFLNYGDEKEGELTKLRASLVCEPTLAQDAKTIDLGSYVLLSNGEEMTGGRDRKSITSDALEALIGAIYLDGGIEPAKVFIHRFILNDIEHKKLFHDSKTYLQEIIQENPDNILEYVLVDESGPAHLKTFTVSARLNGNEIGHGKGSNKKSAEQEAAYYAILKLKGE